MKALGQQNAKQPTEQTWTVTRNGENVIRNALGRGDNVVLVHPIFVVGSRIIITRIRNSSTPNTKKHSNVA